MLLKLAGIATLSIVLAADVALTPPMGWNSWDCYGTTVTEAEVKENADYMAKNLKRHGWEYVVVDIQWSDASAKAHGYRPDAELSMDEYGRLIPAVNRFPLSAGGKGFKPLADYVHSLGLKFGIHIMRGIPRRAVKANLPVLEAKVRAADIADPYSICPWNTDMFGVDMSKPGAQAYYDSIIKLYAEWGVDYIKADDIARPAHRDEIAALHQAIQKTGRPIVLSVSPGPAMVKDLDFLRENTNLWRISDDFWDDWSALRLNFRLMSVWAGAGRPGGWPDADMLPLGRIGIRAERGDDRRSRFTRDEQRTLMTLWSIAQSPLMFGGDLPSNDDATLSLITNDEVLAVNQRALHGFPVSEDGPRMVWAADATDSDAKYVAVFNVGDGDAIDIRVDWRSLKLPERCRVRNLWEHKDVGEVAGGYTFHVPAHGSGLYKISPPPRGLALEGDLDGVHDPAIIKERDTYYVFSTNGRAGDMIPIRCSTDLMWWQRCGHVFDQLPEWAVKEIPGARAPWAPDVSFWNGRYHVYYSVSTFGKNESAIGLATNATLDPARPDYRWIDEGMVVRSHKEDDWNAIDPNLVIEDKDHLWLNWGSFWGGIKMRRIDPASGKLSAADTTLYSLASRPRTPEIKGSIEGPYMIRHDGYWYLFASFDFCCRGAKSTYNIVVGRSQQVTGPFLDRDGKPMAEGGGTPVLAATTPNWRGPGHNSVLREGETDYLVFHAYEGTSGRSRLHISTMHWRDGWPVAGALP